MKCGELAKTRDLGFGFFTSPDKVRAETMEALRSSVATLTAKAPDEVEPYRTLVLSLADAVAKAKGDEAPAETSMIAEIREVLGGS